MAEPMAVWALVLAAVDAVAEGLARAVGRGVKLAAAAEKPTAWLQPVVAMLQLWVPEMVLSVGLKPAETLLPTEPVPAWVQMAAEVLC